MCTDRLELHNAARRVFLEDGTEVFSTEEIHRDADIYVSAGENFKDPYKDIKRKFAFTDDININGELQDHGNSNALYSFSTIYHVKC